MIYIFHGDDQHQSRQAQNRLVDSSADSQVLRLDSKSITPEQVNNFLNGQTLFDTPKILVLNNLFSLSKIDKIVPVIHQSSSMIIIWQDKKLNQSQLKLFPQAEVQTFNPSSNVFSVVNSIKPHNLRSFIQTYRNGLQTEAFDLIFYLIKNSLRKQLVSGSRFNQLTLKKAYLNLIELEFQNKTGRLTTPKEIALERIITMLIESV